MIIKFICLTIHCFLYFVANSKLTDSSTFYEIMIIEFIDSTIQNIYTLHEWLYVDSWIQVHYYYYGYIIDVSWYSNTFLNIQAQPIKEVRDEEKWSSIFLHI